LQIAHVHLSQLETSDEGVELSQLQRVVLDAFLMAVFLQVLGRGGPERAQFARAIEFGFAKLDQPLREILLGLPDVARSSALANACSSELLIDVPDRTAFGETRRSSVSHGAEACMTIDDLGEPVVPVVQGRVVTR
jgi:hypothetical protein